MITEVQERTAARGERIASMCLVIHASPKPAEACLDGRGFSIPPNTVFEVPPIDCTDHDTGGVRPYSTPPHIVMAKLIEQCWGSGLVEVPVIKKAGKFGVQYAFDEEAAHAKAKAAYVLACEKVMQHYVLVQRDRMTQGAPALPPSGRAAEVIAELHIDLKKEYNLEPVGFGTVARASAVSEEIEAVKRENSELRQRLEDFMAQFAPKQEGKKKGE